MHFVSTPCHHTLSDTLRPHTLSLRFVESERASECSGSPFASDAHWSPRSPRCIDAAHGWRTTPPGTAGSSVPAFPFTFDAPVPNHPASRPGPSSRYSEPPGRASRPRHAATRCDRRAADRTLYRQPRPFRARCISLHSPGRCPGLVYHAPSGLVSTLSQHNFVASLTGNFVVFCRKRKSKRVECAV